MHTSKRVGGKGGGAHEVNRRSVLASHQFGHARLVHFCAGMNLSPPVTKKASGKYFIQIEKAVWQMLKVLCKKQHKGFFKRSLLKRLET